MTYRLAVRWPDPTLFAGRAGPVRILAVSDDLDPALDHETNRAGLGPIDLVVGCGDLDADELCFLADAFRAPLVYVRGNHDRGARWSEAARRLPSSSRGIVDAQGLRIVGLPWPGADESGVHARRNELGAWVDVASVLLGLVRRRLTGGGRRKPLLVVSHAAPRGLGDARDAYHVGFGAYRWLLDRLRPPVWLHGHTNPVSARSRRVDADGTTVFNVTGSVLLELCAPGDGERQASGPDGR